MSLAPRYYGFDRNHRRGRHHDRVCEAYTYSPLSAYVFDAKLRSKALHTTLPLPPDQRVFDPLSRYTSSYIRSRMIHRIHCNLCILITSLRVLDSSGRIQCPATLVFHYRRTPLACVSLCLH